MGSCGDREPTGADRLAGRAAETRTVRALTAADQTPSARASAYMADATAASALAASQRQQAQIYDRWTPDAADRVTTNWNAKMKAECLALATAADKQAADAQKAANFELARAAAGGGR